MNRSHLKTAGALVGILSLLFLMVWVRAYIGSMHAWEQGEALLQEKKYIRAVTFFDRAIHWYTPFNPYVEKSAQRLWEIGTRAEKDGDRMLALIAFRTIRRGFYGTEGLNTPGKGWIDKSNAKIRGLSKQEKTQGERSMAKPLQPPPDIFWSLMVEVGLLGWLVTMVILVFRLFKRKQGGKVPVYSCIAWGVLSCCFLGLWIVGLLKA